MCVADLESVNGEKKKDEANGETRRKRTLDQAIADAVLLSKMKNIGRVR